MFGFSPAIGTGSITKQLYGYLRDQIESGLLPPGLKLPPTRRAAQDMGIARNIVIEVYEQLTSEGYLCTHIGSGTYIAEGAQNKLLPQLEHEALQAAPGDAFKEINFDAGTPDLRYFPRKLWSKYTREIMSYEMDNVLDYGDCRGHKTLREAITRYVYRAKGIRCSPDDIIITSGTSNSFLLLASALSGQFQTAYIEDPTIGFTSDIFGRLKYNLYPVPVDNEGMVLKHIPRTSPAGLIIVTPSHQYPTGSVLSMQRRREAVKLAEASGHYIVEDDYDSEFRHKGSPIPPLQILAPSRVIYAGTFSKTLSPTLRIGFLIVPPSLIDQVLQTKFDMNLASSNLTQSALARFMMDGHFERHIHKMKALYRKKRIFLEGRLRLLFKEEACTMGVDTGMHIQILFRPEIFGGTDWKQLEAYGVRLGTFEDYARLKGNHPGRLVMGYGNLTLEEIDEGLQRLHRFIKTVKDGQKG
ncbi:MocR-like pyridoxine biosynthesis transcription factor PdxR [Paenibacillus massiliensis]|uniref:MocR-like pyridoxine biosynthesis transcription factor PdxR n=1 Tax=Paenibacillus massiliensis TaxID=225917 RepID=UPI0003FECB93|nr:PLP-dependent aminotransferase family protein [Paenibacillus massiliensis]